MFFRNDHFFASARASTLWVLLLVTGFAATSTGAPISGSFQADFVMHGATCGVDDDGDTFVDEDMLNGTDDDQDGSIDEDNCPKIDDTVLKFEADLVLHLTVSGLQISSTTVFTFKGLEYQSLALATTIGALSIRDIFIFAPSIVEIQEVRTQSTLKVRYCINTAAPIGTIDPFLPCPMPDNLLYQLLEDPLLFHPAVANLRLAEIFDEAGALDPVLTFRKKIVDLSLYLMGLVFQTHAMFANVGSVTAPSYRAGVMLALEGQTVGGITFRSELWVGARQGLECFAECKPAERLYGGIVIDNLSIQEEKLFIRNLTIAGVTFNIRTEFNFFAEPDTYCPTQGICYLEIHTRGQLAPLGFTLENMIRFDGTLTPRFDFIKISFKLGDVSATVIWYYYLYETNEWESKLVELITSFDPPGVTLTSDLLVCTSPFTLCISPSGVYEHYVTISSTTNGVSWEAQFIFLGLISDFYQVSVDTSWRLGGILLTGSVILSSKSLDALALSTRIEF